MSLQTDRLFYSALRRRYDGEPSVSEMVGERVYNTSIPVPDEDLENEPVPYIIISFDGMVNQGTTKDYTFEGDDDVVTVSVEVTAKTREELYEVIHAARVAIRRYMEDDPDSEEVPESYDMSAGRVEYDAWKPCFWQTLTYRCVMQA